jgi:putative transposase
VSRSGFFAWLSRSPSARAKADDAIAARVRASYIQSDRTYGARRVWRDVLAEGISCGLHRIEKLMRLQAFRARPRRRRLPSDTGVRSTAAVAPNTLDRRFEATAPNRKWVADFTYIWTAEGWLYVAAVIDLHSRRVVGWSMSAEMTSDLVTNALMMALWRRGKPDALLHHSDRGSQYTSEAFQRLMADHGVTCSMSRAGNCWGEPSWRHRFEPDGERGDGELLLLAEDGTDSAEDVPDTRRSEGRRVRRHRVLLQSKATSLDARLSQPDCVRGTGGVSLGRRPRNRGQPTAHPG